MTQPVTFRAGGKRWKSLIGITFFALFWNGIVSVFVYNLYKDWNGGAGSWGMAAFLSIFVVVGLLVIVGVFHQLLAMFNPKPILSLPSDAVRLGEPLDVAWDMTGNVNRIGRLKLVLEGKEIAMYRRGTSTVTVDETFAELILCDTDDQREMVTGAASMVIPLDTMHSFKAVSNKITWQLHVKGDIPRWPDINDAFDITVEPSTGEAR